MSSNHSKKMMLPIVSAVAALALGPTRAAYADDCSHSTQTVGSQLAYGCNTCVTTVCEADWYCCELGWDGTCVGEADSMCPEAPESPVYGTSLAEGDADCPAGGVMLDVAGEKSFLCNAPPSDVVVGRVQALSYPVFFGSYAKANAVHVDGGAYVVQVLGLAIGADVDCRLRRTGDNQILAKVSTIPSYNGPSQRVMITGASSDIGATDIVFECKRTVTGFGGSVSTDSMTAIRVGGVAIQNNAF